MTATSTVADFYNRNVGMEHLRLLEHRLEFEVSLRVILQTISDLSQSLQLTSGLEVLDLGGGTGRYAIELAKRFHRVTLSDISHAELARAKAYATYEDVRLSAIVQVDARDVRSEPSIYKANKYDVILCQGPMYHLLEVSERMSVLDACHNMLKPGGVVFLAFVTKYAHLRDIARKDPKRLLKEREFYSHYLASGNYTRNPSIVSHHIEADDIETLFFETVAAFGWSEHTTLRVTKIVGCEGFLGGGLEAELKHLDSDEFEQWVQITLKFAERIASTADHILVVAAKGNQ